MNEIEKIFEKEAVHIGGLILYSREVSLEVISKCKNLNIRILGVDGFYITKDKIQPSLDDIIDFSNSYNEENNYIQAEQFVKNRSSEMFFEIVYESNT